MPRAIDEHEQALVLRQQLVVESPGQSGFRNELASTEVALGRLLAGRDAKRSAELIDNGVKRARSLVDADPINNEWKDTLVQGLLARAELQKLANDRPAARTTLGDALTVAKTAVERAKANANWPGLLAEVYAGLAELAPDPAAAAIEWRHVRDTLEPLAKTNRLSATRKPLLDRARR
jgi:hypothetical protein